MGVQEFDFQPDPKKPIVNEIASVATDFNMFQGYLDQIPNPDEVLRLECGGDISIYDAIGRDPRISSNLGVRARGVVGLEWNIIPFSQETIDITIGEYVKNVYLNFPFDRTRRSFHRGGNLKGFAVGEIMWDYSEGDTFITAMHYRHQRRFTFNVEQHLLLKTLANPLGENVTIRDGVELKKFQRITYGDEVTTPWGCGLGRELYWHWWFKKNDIRSWLQSGDKFAAPTAIGEYEIGTSKVDQDKLLAAAMAIHSRSALVHPKGMSLRLMDALRSGSISTYKELVDFLNEEITICILGQTATTTGTAGKLGNEKEQGDVFRAIIKADADSECEAYNARQGGMIRWLVDYQFPGHNRYPKMWIDCEEEEDKKTLAERDDKLTTAMERSGLRLKSSYYVRVHGVQEEEIETIPLTPPLSEGKQKPSPDKGSGEGLAFAEGDDTTLDPSDLLADQLGRDAMTASDHWIDQLQRLTMSATSLEDLRDRIIALYGQMDPAELGGLIARATMLANASGRSEVQDGN